MDGWLHPPSFFIFCGNLFDYPGFAAANGRDDKRCICGWSLPKCHTISAMQCKVAKLRNHKHFALTIRSNGIASLFLGSWCASKAITAFCDIYLHFITWQELVRAHRIELVHRSAIIGDLPNWWIRQKKNWDHVYLIRAVLCSRNSSSAFALTRFTRKLLRQSERISRKSARRPSTSHVFHSARVTIAKLKTSTLSRGNTNSLTSFNVVCILLSK